MEKSIFYSFRCKTFVQRIGKLNEFGMQKVYDVFLIFRIIKLYKDIIIFEFLKFCYSLKKRGSQATRTLAFIWMLDPYEVLRFPKKESEIFLRPSKFLRMTKNLF